ncbi:hypothetical protein BN890_37730 [Bacteroides xylanisolvens SD CC 1b]|uniref:Uncharacterized protein n=1 Tax=Bacteroides xylanisolvens SD CC 1b TaxID=702447 RepID=W6PQA8_9BACE|nr:hypothetical protein HMPREF0102_02162 [Bacteroides sp. 2_1_22]CDM06170.1 hypothetical protein BN890_37730 [Bacteroides xylanisolvens SD CC 1b]
MGKVIVKPRNNGKSCIHSSPFSIDILRSLLSILLIPGCIRY